MKLRFCLILLLLLAACADDEEQLKVKRDIANLGEKLYQLERTQAETREKLQVLGDELSKKLEDRSNQAAVQNEVRQLKDSLAQHTARIEDLERQLAAMRRQKAVVKPAEVEADPNAPTTQPTGGEGGDTVSGTAVENQFNAAYSDYTRGKYDVSSQAFQDIVTNFPTAPQAEGALYYLGRSHISLENWQNAVDAFDQLRDKYPQGSFVRPAMYYTGECFYRMNSHSKAVLILRELIEKYPGTQEADLAKGFLKKAGYEK